MAALMESFMTRRLGEEYPYLILDARYERVRENGVGHIFPDERAVAARARALAILLSHPIHLTTDPLLLNLTDTTAETLPTAIQPS